MTSNFWIYSLNLLLRRDMMASQEALQQILARAHTLAIVGFSSNRMRAGYYVPAYLQRAGFNVIPVNPNLESGLGKPCYPELKKIPDPIDGVVIFRRPEHIPAIVEQAIEVGAWFVWMQLGIVHDQAAQMAKAAGLQVVMDACMMVEHRRYAGRSRIPFSEDRDS